MRPGGTVLALDLATLSGFVHGVPGMTPNAGHIRFKGSTDAEVGKSCLTWAHEFFQVLKPSVLVIEEPKLIQNRRRPTNKATLKRLWGLSMIVQAVAAAHEITDIRICTADEAREQFLGSASLDGERAKKLVQARCQQLGWAFATPDEADGLALWSWGCEQAIPGAGAKPSVETLQDVAMARAERKQEIAAKRAKKAAGPGTHPGPRRRMKAPERMTAKEAAQLLFQAPVQPAKRRT